MHERLNLFVATVSIYFNAFQYPATVAFANFERKMATLAQNRVDSYKIRLLRFK